MSRNLFPIVLLVALVLGCQQKQAAPPTDTHGLAEEVHHKPELARKIIADVVAEPHGVTMIAEELAKNEMAAASVVDELMKQPAIADAIADRCAAAAIARQVEGGKSSSKKR
ncbi:MAG TPA: hypothetical protein VJZ00_11190 [Thermoanaerobaculia bacterium]|nr:hypothetical protein [Thermoanaerobaculia bacterium]